MDSIRLLPRLLATAPNRLSSRLITQFNHHIELQGSVGPLGNPRKDCGTDREAGEECRQCGRGRIGGTAEQDLEPANPDGFVDQRRRPGDKRHDIERPRHAINLGSYLLVSCQ